MSLPAILEKIRESGQGQLHGIEARARVTAAETLTQAQTAARQIEAEARESASAPGVAERARILHRARMDSLRLVGAVREDLLDAAFASAGARLSSIRADSVYPGVLRAFIEEALKELAAEAKDGALLEADPRDKALIEAFAAESAWKLSTTYPLTCWGGVIVKSPDGKVVVINTLESRLERIAPFLRSRLAAFFERDQAQENESHG